MARRLGIQYMIWKGKIWGAYNLAGGWRKYTGPDPHTNHVHISMTWAGTMGQTSFWSSCVAPSDGSPTNKQTADKFATKKCATPTIKQGASGPSVTLVQRLLKITADGTFGAGTKTAVVAYQKSKGLTQSGTVDAKTWSALGISSTGVTTPPTSTPTPNPTKPPTTPPPTPPTTPTAPTTPTTSTPTSTSPLGPYMAQRLKSGSTGAGVKALQTALKVKATSTFDTATKTAVVKFQSAHKLDADGIVGPLTWTALDKERYPLQPYLTQRIKTGSSGNAVKALQTALKVKATSTFDTTTKTAVTKYQSAHKLDADAIVGPLTWTSLNQTVYGVTPPKAAASTGSSAAETKPKTTPLDAYAKTTVQYGATSKSVKAIQTALKVKPVSGWFGPVTKAAVKKFQAAHKISATGVVNPTTWTALKKYVYGV
jgi:peptidoglycan hydrolase-like protein with peptidoglycan-binding domain